MIRAGLSQDADTESGVRQAIARSDFKGKPGWVLAVAGRRHVPEDVLAAIQRALPGVPVYGGSCVGAMAASRVGYSGHEIALALFDDSLGVADCIVESISGREAAAGRALGDWIGADPSTSAAFLFYAVAREQGGMNVGSALLDAIYERLPQAHSPAVLGAGLIADFEVTQSYLFDGNSVRRDAALVLRMPPGLEVSTRIMHGCTPASPPLMVTRAEGAAIFEIDNRPAVDVLREYAARAGEDEYDLAFSVLLGRRMGDAQTSYEEADYVNRLVIDVDKARGAVRLFEEDIKEGDLVQLMIRNNTLLMDSVKEGVEGILRATEDADRQFALYIDCAGRAAVFTNSESEESEALLKRIGENFPVLGFYVGREVAPFAGRSRPLDWTGVLAVFSRRQPKL